MRGSPSTCASVDRGEPGGFDSVDAAARRRARPTRARFCSSAGEGEALRANHRVATIKVGTDDLCLIEFELEPAHEGPDPHSHTDHTDSFYVLDGTVEFQLGDEKLVGRPGIVRRGAPGRRRTHSGPAPTARRMLNIHAPSTGFHDRLRAMG